ncbi:MAG: hypothetical protein JWO81_3038 [Alphaproteobacteria bacterium]|nr:hypothetical protein [Alphaproteobacteria bacterium]
MMRARTCVAIGLALALVACGKSGGQNGAKGAAGSAAPAGVSGAVNIQPGEWETISEVTNVNGAGLPPAYAATMKGQKSTRRSCITPEEAARPMGKMMEAQKNNACNYSNFSIAGGHIQGSISCGGGKTASKMTMTMNGQYDAQNYTYTSSMTNEGQGMNMTIETRAAAHRVGDCPAGGAENGQ